MKATFTDALLHLPVDATLRSYLQREGLNPPDDFDWSDTATTSAKLIDEVVNCPDVAVRERIIAGLQAGTRLGHPQGKQAMFQATVQRGQVMMELVACQSDLHRSFWLFVHHPDLFEMASEFEYVDSRIAQAQQHDLGTKASVRRDEAAMQALRENIQAFYKAELGCGDVCVANLLDRAGGTQLLTVHAKDLATVQLEFSGQSLARRIGNPNIPMVLEYSRATGVARTIIRGGAKYHAMLAQAFSKHLLAVDVDAQRIKPPMLDLSALKLGFQVPQAVNDGFIALQVKSIAVHSDDGTLKAEFTAMAASERRCVTELIAEQLPRDNPLTHGWLVTSASINLYYPPAPGRQRCRAVTVQVTRNGRLNLHKFDDQLRSQLESYLVSIGILRPEQRLAAPDTSLEVQDDLLVDELGQ